MYRPSLPSSLPPSLFLTSTKSVSKGLGLFKPPITAFGVIS